MQRQLGTIHQQFDLVEQLRTVHNVNAGRLGSWSLARAVVSLLVPRDVDRARHALERVGIGDKLYERTGNLSGGEQQRVAIARVLAQRPAAVLADEPLASLDPARGREIMNLLHDISREMGTTLLASLHDVEIALEAFERVVGLREGCIAFDVPPRQLSWHGRRSTLSTRWSASGTAPDAARRRASRDPAAAAGPEPAGGGGDARPHGALAG